MFRAIGIGLCSLVVGQAVAAFDVVNQFRETNVTLSREDGSFNFTHAAGNDAFGPWDHFSSVYSGASPNTLFAETAQHSTTSPLRFSGSGWAYAENLDAAAWDAQFLSYMAIEFAITEPVTVHVEGQVQRSGNGSLAAVQLRRGGEALLYVHPDDDELAYFDLDIPLAIGSYELNADAVLFDAPAQVTGGAEWQLDFAIIPEPATIGALVVLALLARPGRAGNR